MKKDFIICICAIVLGISGWIGEKEYDRYQAWKLVEDQRKISLQVHKQQEEAKQQAVASMREKQQQALAAQRAEAQRAALAARQEIEAALKGYKISSIMLGSPSLAIINKKNYEEGSDLSLADGKVLKVSAIQDSRVLLAYNGQTFHIDMPASKELGGAPR